MNSPTQAGHSLTDESSLGPSVVVPDSAGLPSTFRIPNLVAEYLRANPSYLSSSQSREHSDLAEAYFVERVWRKDWLALLRYLPDRVESVLDVGGGIGGVSLLIHRFAGQPTITLIEQAVRHLQGKDFYVLNLAGD